ncbi:hypothetical protein D9V87_03865 [Bacteroidetes/Chlorobi group bacterium MS-B_bin-24]|jgi:hypothetical protein|nr:MAG: hypothetical protein D9V87_03865 [Bacteroidetes/Chlorobi group bacterium MS-B_bin-24]
MKVEYQYIESDFKHYKGVSFSDIEYKELLKNEVKDKLLDTPQRNEMISNLKALKSETGFEVSERLLIDIQYLQNPKVDVQDFRIGEAFAEVCLEKHFNCRFYWNELRDARNPKGNKTGADLVGFIEIGNEILFLFGEVKTSSEQKSPPQVMTNPTGIENQLRDLYRDQNKRCILISYIQNKIGLSKNRNFQNDFNNAILNYYRQNEGKYMLYGILVRDTDVNENDVRVSYNKLKNQILDPIGLRLLAIYVSIPKNQWLKIINGDKNVSN